MELVLWEFSGRRKYFMLHRVSGGGGIREGFKEEGACKRQGVEGSSGSELSSDSE